MTAAPVAVRPPQARLRLLDGFEFQSDGRRVDLPIGTQRVVAFLAFHERPLLRTYVAGCLWLDTSLDRSQANLRSALWRLRRPAAGLVESRGAHLALADDVDVDVHRIVSVARAHLDGRSTTTQHADSELLCGDLLPDWYEDWVVLERERLRQLRLHALEALCRTLTDGGRFGEAVDVGMAAVATEPLRESARYALIRAHLAEGNKAEATKQYTSYRDHLRAELGVEPSALLIQLVADAIGMRHIDGWRGYQGTARPSAQ